MSIKMTATRQKHVETLIKILMLRGNWSHTYDIVPMRANKKPRKVRRTQREWHRANRWVGSRPWKGPTCTRCGLVDQIIRSPVSRELILTRPPMKSVPTSSASEVRNLLAFSGSFKEMDVGESTRFSSASCSSFWATASLCRTRKNAARKDMIAVKKIKCYWKVNMGKEPTCMSMDD